MRRQPSLQPSHQRATLALHLALACTSVGCAEDPVSQLDVLYQGGATDEGLVSFLDITAKQGPEVAKFTWPANGETLPVGAALSFCFQVGDPTAMAPPSTGPSPGGQPQRVASPSWAERGLAFALGGIETAHAHGTPMNGTAYYVVFSTPAQPGFLRVFTTETHFVADEAQRAKFNAVEENVHVDLSHAVFAENRIVDGGGPFIGTPIDVTILR